MLSNPFRGAFYLFKGATLLFTPGIKRYVVIPLLINALLFGGLVFFGINQFETLLQWLMPELPEWLQWVVWLLWLLFGLAALIIIFYTFTLLANIISAPFNAALAEALERHLTGRKIEQSTQLSRVFKDIGQALKQEAIKFKYMGVRALPLLILFFIPGVNIVAPIIWMTFCAWLLALEYMDYPMSNHGIKFMIVRERVAEKRLLNLGFGGITMLATLIPIINFIVIPSAVAGATLLWVNEYADANESLPQPLHK